MMQKQAAMVIFDADVRSMGRVSACPLHDVPDHQTLEQHQKKHSTRKRNYKVPSEHEPCRNQRQDRNSLHNTL